MYIGIDIGGTKCAVIGGTMIINVCVKNKMRFDTASIDETMKKIVSAVENLLLCDAIGVSCGGPLDENCWL